MSYSVIDIHPESYLDAAELCGRLRDDAAEATERWLAELRECAGMAGSCDAAVAFAADYDAAAAQILEGLDTLEAALDQLRYGLELTARNHVWGEWSSRLQPGSAPEIAVTPAAPRRCRAAPAPAAGEPNSSLPDVPEWVADFLLALWPDGDTDALARAESAWRELAEDVTGLRGRARGILDHLARVVSPEIPQIEERVHTLLDGLSSLREGAGETAAALHDFSAGPEGIQQTRADTLSEVNVLLVELDISIGFAAVTSFFTLGASAVVEGAAITGRVALSAGRIAGFVANLGIRAQASAARIAAVVGRLTLTGRRFEAVTTRAVLFSGRSAATVVGGTASSVTAEWVVRGEDFDLESSVVNGLAGSAIGGALGHVMGSRFWSARAARGPSGTGMRPQLGSYSLRPENAGVLPGIGREYYHRRLLSPSGAPILSVGVRPTGQGLLSRAPERIVRIGEGGIYAEARRLAIDADSYGFHELKHVAPPSELDWKLMNKHVLDLVEDRAHPYGFDADLHALSAAEYQRKYLLHQIDDRTGLHWSRFPSAGGSIAGSDRVYARGWEEFHEHNPGFTVDRIGADSGKYFGIVIDGVPFSFEARAMDIHALMRAPYSLGFLVPRLPEPAGDWIIHTSRAAPAMGQPGGAGQLRILAPRAAHEISDPGLRHTLERLERNAGIGGRRRVDLLEDHPLDDLYAEVSQAWATKRQVLVIKKTYWPEMGPEGAGR